MEEPIIIILNSGDGKKDLIMAIEEEENFEFIAFEQIRFFIRIKNELMRMHMSGLRNGEAKEVNLQDFSDFVKINLNGEMIIENNYSKKQIKFCLMEKLKEFFHNKKFDLESIPIFKKTPKNYLAAIYWPE